VDETDPDQIRLISVEDRLGADPWAKAMPVDLGPVVGKVERSLADAEIELEPFDRFRS
jgi:hypothetical protein